MTLMERFKNARRAVEKESGGEAVFGEGRESLAASEWLMAAYGGAAGFWREAWERQQAQQERR